VEVYFSPSGSTALNSITDSCSDTFHLVDNPTTTTNVGASAGAYAYNVTGGNCTVTATFNLTGSIKFMAVHNVSGALATGDPLDQHLVGRTAFMNSTCSNCLSSGSVTTTQNNEYIFGACVSSTTASFLTAGTAYTVRQSQTAYGLTEDRALLAAGSVAVTCSRSTSSTANVNAHIMTFKSATP
jgi:hypothetical protein